MSEMSSADLIRTVNDLIEGDIPTDHIKNNILPNLGILQESIPQEVLDLLEG